MSSSPVSPVAPPPAKKSASAARRSARIVAVQALYQQETTPLPLPRLLQQLANQPLVLLDEVEAATGSLTPPDQALLRQILTGVEARASDIDQLITGSLATAYPLPRLEQLLRAILRAGTYELLENSDQTPALLINDYVDVAHAFFAQSEPAMVNGVLDKIAKNLRPVGDER